MAPLCDPLHRIRDGVSRPGQRRQSESPRRLPARSRRGRPSGCESGEPHRPSLLHAKLLLYLVTLRNRHPPPPNSPLPLPTLTSRDAAKTNGRKITQPNKSRSTRWPIISPSSLFCPWWESLLRHWKCERCAEAPLLWYLCHVEWNTALLNKRQTKHNMLTELCIVDIKVYKKKRATLQS